VNSDYRDLPSPRAGYNVDIIRCLLALEDVEEMLACQ